jgi:subfamily B ATP-binding cassette protein MsbA
MMSSPSMPPASRVGLAHFVADLARPYRGWLVVILVAMLVETAMGLAGPWPLKIVIDYAVGTHATPHWLNAGLGPALVADKRALTAAAAFTLIAIAFLGGVASYVDNYYTESVGQWVATTFECASSSTSSACHSTTTTRIERACCSAR